MNVFKEAKKYINEGIIRSYFDCDKSKIIRANTGRELVTLCPFRNDTKPGSFFINLDTGMWIEKSTAANENQGDFIKLVSLAYNLSPTEAAEKILSDSGQIIYKEPAVKSKSREKIKAVIPIPEEKLEDLNKFIKSDYIINRYGKIVAGWKYRDKNNEIWLCTARHEKPGQKKDVIPYFFGIDKKWHTGMPVKKNRLFYGIDRIEKAVKDGEKKLKILVVEGEKCADVEVPGWILITWSGGVGQVKQTNWKLLNDYKKYVSDICMWPDFDQELDKNNEILPVEKQPGMTAALYIQSQVSKIKILDVYSDSDKPPKWDIYNAYQDGIDLIDFIEKKNFLK